MKRIIWLAIFPLAFVLPSGCKVPTTSQTPLAQVIAPVVVPQGAVGKNCILRMRSPVATTIQESSGKIVAYDDKSIVLSDATRTVQAETSIPVIGKIPLLAKSFKNVGIGSESVTGYLRVPLSEVEDFKITDQSPLVADDSDAAPNSY